MEKWGEGGKVGLSKGRCLRKKRCANVGRSKINK